MRANLADDDFTATALVTRNYQLAGLAAVSAALCSDVREQLRQFSPDLHSLRLGSAKEVSWSTV